MYDLDFLDDDDGALPQDVTPAWVMDKPVVSLQDPQYTRILIREGNLDLLHRDLFDAGFVLMDGRAVIHDFDQEYLF